MASDILMIVAGVKLKVVSNQGVENNHRKKPGKVTVFPVAIQWEAPEVGVKLQIPVHRIAKQFVSKAGAKHSLLQLRLNDGPPPSEYKFTLPNDDLRDQLKDTIANMKDNPVAMPTGPKEDTTDNATGSNGKKETTDNASSAKQKEDELVKISLLKNNPQLLELFRRLTSTGGMTADEFWEGYNVNSHQHQHGNDTEKLGVSSGVLQKFKPTEQRGNNERIGYKITGDMQQQLFALYPNLKSEHDASVPVELSEREFWERVVNSQKLYRDTSNMNPDQVGDFTELFAKARQRTGVSSSNVVQGAEHGDLSKKRKVMDPRFELDADEEAPESDTEDDPNDKRRREKVKHKRKERRLCVINQDSSGILGAMISNDSADTLDRHKILRDSVELTDLREQKKAAHKSLTFRQQQVLKDSETNSNDQELSISGDDLFNTSDLSLDDLDVPRFSENGSKVLQNLSNTVLHASRQSHLNPSAAALVVKFDEAISGVLRCYWRCFSPFAKLVDMKFESALGKKASRMVEGLKTTVLMEKLPELKEKLGDDRNLMANLEARVLHAVKHHDKEWQAKRKRLIEFKKKQLPTAKSK